MSRYTPEQVVKIRRAVAAAREAMRRRDSYTPVVFARAFIEGGGIQIPGAAGDERACREAGEELIAALSEDRPISGNPLAARELQRVRTEVRWAAAACSDKVVGFRLQLPGAAQRHAECRALLGTDRGLGPAVFPKGEVVVLPPACECAEFIPVLEDDIEQ